MDIILTCRECGHVEQDGDARTLMVKVRMLNHLNHEHQDTVESFREAIAESYEAVAR